MITTNFIQCELAEIRRLIKQDIREELRAVSQSRGFCPNCAGAAASLRKTATDSNSHAPPSVTNGFDKLKESCYNQQNESIKRDASGSMHFDDLLLPHSVPEQVLESERVSDHGLIPFVRTVSISSTSTKQTNATQDSGAEGKNLSVTDRWKALCSGLLGKTSVIHEYWVHSRSRPSHISFLNICSAVLVQRGSEVEAPIAWWIIDPFSTRRFSWDLIGIALCLYDLIMVPVHSAFTLPSSYDTFRNVRDLCSASFWSLDIFVSFITGSPDKDGLVEVKPKKIARKYISTWFLFDLSIVSIDWVVLLLAAFGVSGSMRVGKAFTRVLRASRLLRILKMSEKVREVMGTVETELLFTVGTVTKQVAFLFAICHYFACAWYSIGTIHDDSRSWPKVFLNAGDSQFFAYAASLHYSLTQFTFGYTDITPQTVTELIFVNIVLVVALLVFSAFTSAVTKAITHLEQVNAAQLAQDVKFRQFCSENQVPRKLMARVRNFIRQRARSYNHRLVSETDIEVFQALPVVIVQQLREHRFLRHLLLHPLFKQCSILHMKAMREICWSGVEEVFLLPGQECFPNGMDINRMIFLMTGKLAYRIDDDANVDPKILPGMWACEESLWSMKPRLLAPLVACDGSQLMLVVPDKLRELASRDMLVHDVFAVYAEVFIERFNEATLDELYDSVLFNDPLTLRALVRESWKKRRKTPVSDW